MECILKFRSPDLHTIIIVTKMKKGFVKKKERVKGFFIFMTMHFYSSILNLTTIRKSPANKIVIGLLSFLIA